MCSNYSIGLKISALKIVKRFAKGLQVFFKRKTTYGYTFALVIFKNIKL